MLPGGFSSLRSLQLMKDKSLVICPMFNEHDSLEEFYGRLREAYSGDVLLVDDGSTDGSKDLLSAIRDDNTSIISHPTRRGYGAALISGFAYSLKEGYRKVVTLDVDLQHSPEQVNTFLRELESYEVVLGSRYIRIDRYLDIPHVRLIINRYIAGLIRTLFAVDFSDPFCGYRGYRESFLRSADLREYSYGQGLEILMELIRMKTPFREIPIDALYPNPYRQFLDGLDDPRLRLLHYLGVIARKRQEIEGEEKTPQTAPER